MAPRPMASATVSFGMVSIPVSLFSASEPRSSVSFNMLHGKCKGRLKQQYICPADDNVVVPRSEMVKGYEFEKGRYVTFTDDEVKALQQEASKLIEITEFVPLAKVDPIFFSGAYNAVNAAYNVVVFPLPVGPVTSTIP